MKLKEIVPEYHSKNIFIRNLFFKRLESAIKLVRQKLEADESLRIIDLGCGEGVLLKLLEESFKNIETFGIDINPNTLELNKFLRANVKISDIKDTGFPDNFFDIVFCLDVLEHFENLAKPIGEIKRILKPNGLLVVSLPVESWFYKLGRLFVKGTISEKKGPCSSPHFGKAKTVENFLCSNELEIVEKVFLPKVSFLSLFHIVSLRKK